jgi:MFS family permease
MISNKQLAALFMCSLVSWIIVQGLLSLLPVYAVRLGADPASTGYFLAFAFFALVLGTVSAGWLSDKFQKRKTLLIVAGFANIPITWLMGQATAFWQLAALTAIVWFFVGMTFTTISTLAGLFAGEAERGKVFGILAVNTSLGALIGGSLSGRIVDQWGYPGLFLIAAIWWLFQPLTALFIQDKVVAKPQYDTKVISPTQFGWAFYLFLLAHVIAFGANFFSLLGRPLLMDSLHFDAATISGVLAVGGVVSIPLPILAGWLSDRVGRYGLIMLCFLMSALGLFILAGSAELWHFWVSSILLAGTGVSLAIGPALVTDLVPPESLGKALAWYGFAPSTGGIIGFATTGYAIQTFGTTITFIAGAVLTVIAIAFVIQVQRVRQPSLADAVPFE